MENNDEINIMHIFSSLKKGLKKALVLGFNVLDFIIKKWIIILLLIIAGIVLGYFSNKNYKEDKSAKVLLRVNHDAVNYVYNEIDFLNEKINEKDSVFFKEIGFQNDEIVIKELEITPIVDLTDISKSYDVNDRNLEGLLRNLEFSTSEIEITETFISKYKNHTLDIKLSSSADYEAIINLINYFNDNEIIERIKDTTISDIKTHIALNKNSISQINKIIDNYTKTESLPSPSDQLFIIDKNFSIHGLLLKKSELQKETESLNKFLIYENNIVVIVNKPNIIKVKKGFLGKQMIKYPLLLVFAFLFLSFLRFSYFYLKEVAETSKNE
jgi:hypothetical protein